MKSRHRGNPETRADVEIDMGGERHCLVRGKRHEFGRRTERALPLRVPNPHPLAYACRRDALAHSIDCASTVAMGNDPRISDLARAPLAALDVGGIDAGRRELDPYLAARWH